MSTRNISWWSSDFTTIGKTRGRSGSLPWTTNPVHALRDKIHRLQKIQGGLEYPSLSAQQALKISGTSNTHIFNNMWNNPKIRLYRTYQLVRESVKDLTVPTILSAAQQKILIGIDPSIEFKVNNWKTHITYKLEGRKDLIEKILESYPIRPELYINNIEISRLIWRFSVFWNKLPRSIQENIRDNTAGVTRII